MSRWLMMLKRLDCAQPHCLSGLMVKWHTEQTGRRITCNEVLLKSQLYSASVNRSRNEQQACLGAEDGEWWREALAHTAFRTRLSSACRRQQQQREPQPFHYPPLVTGQLEERGNEQWIEVNTKMVSIKMRQLASWDKKGWIIDLQRKENLSVTKPTNCLYSKHLLL